VSLSAYVGLFKALYSLFPDRPLYSNTLSTVVLQCRKYSAALYLMREDNLYSQTLIHVVEWTKTCSEFQQEIRNFRVEIECFKH